MNLFEKLITMIVETVVANVITSENVEKYGVRLFDLIEDVVEDSATVFDDVAVLPMIRAARAVLGIPDRPDFPEGDA